MKKVLIYISVGLGVATLTYYIIGGGKNTSKEDKENNMNLAYNYIKRGSMTKWTEDFLKDL